eukprot:4062964-Pyramimonas_sp.AAC.1
MRARFCRGIAARASRGTSARPRVGGAVRSMAPRRRGARPGFLSSACLDRLWPQSQQRRFAA